MRGTSTDEGGTPYRRFARWTLTAPWWQLAPMNGLLTGVAFGLLNALLSPGEAPVAGLPYPVFQGLVFGLLMGPFLAFLGVRQRRRLLAAADASPARVARGSRTALRGPVPSDPEDRRVAYELARHQLDQLRRRRVFTLAMFALMIGLSVFLAVVDNPWTWVLAAFFAGMLGYLLWMPARLRRRIELLRPDPDPPRGEQP